MALKRLRIRPDWHPASSANKGRPEQGVAALTGRYGTVLGDTGCVDGGTDQRVIWGAGIGAGDQPGQSGHGCSQE